MASRSKSSPHSDGSTIKKRVKLFQQGAPVKERGTVHIDFYHILLISLYNSYTLQIFTLM